MIKAVFYRTTAEAPEQGGLCGFKVINHGCGIVCAAVSMLTLNTLNSLEALTDAPLEYCYNANGGYVECVLPGDGYKNPAAALLLQSLLLGLEGVCEGYGSGGGGLEIFTEQTDNIKLTKTNNKKHTMFKR